MTEKPIEVTLEKIDRLIDTCRKAKVKLGVIFQRRTMPESIKLKQTIESGKLGKLCFGSAYLKYYRSNDYYKSAGWRATMELDGGGRS